jgi:hypothetical protein
MSSSPVSFISNAQAQVWKPAPGQARPIFQNKNPDYSRLNGRAGVRSLPKAFALAMFNK